VNRSKKTLKSSTKTFKNSTVQRGKMGVEKGKKKYTRICQMQKGNVTVGSSGKRLGRKKREVENTRSKYRRSRRSEDQEKMQRSKFRSPKGPEPRSRGV